MAEKLNLRFIVFAVPIIAGLISLYLDVSPIAAIALTTFVSLPIFFLARRNFIQIIIGFLMLAAIDIHLANPGVSASSISIILVFVALVLAVGETILEQNRSRL